MYEDKDFGNQFFSVTSTAELYDKATVKVVRKESTVILVLHQVDDSDLSSTLSSVGDYAACTSNADNDLSSSSQDTIPVPASWRSAPWPVPFKSPRVFP